MRGSVDEDAFHQSIEYFSGLGAKHVMLKTGAYPAVDLARAIRYSTDAKRDTLAIYRAGGSAMSLYERQPMGPRSCTISSEDFCA